MLRFDRIRHLLSPDELRDKLVVQVGVGSGGAAANDHLTMNGVRRWIIFDPDSYDELNLVKHPRLRAQVGRRKVDNQRDWITDRNPDADVEVHGEDVLLAGTFAEAVRRADLVLCAVDNQEARLYVNSVAVELRKPCVTASVYRQGFGGEVYAYLPGIYGCFDCMGRVATEQGWNIQDSIAPTAEEQAQIYGKNLRDFNASGLSMDIQSIATIHARVVLDTLLIGTAREFAPLPTNWIIFYNRPIPGNGLSGFLKSLHLKVKPQKGCQCGET